MPLKLYYHPLSSYCHKVLIALYENGTPFETQLVNLGDPKDRADFVKLWPIGKFPVIRDEERGQTIPESSPIIEYLARHYPGPAALIPQDAELAWQVRAKDRFLDLYVHMEMQKVVGDRLRPAAHLLVQAGQNHFAQPPQPLHFLRADNRAGQDRQPLLPLELIQKLTPRRRGCGSTIGLEFDEQHGLDGNPLGSAGGRA